MSNLGRSWARVCCMAIASALGMSITGSAAAQTTGRVKVDGSSTVAPILNLSKEQFKATQPGIEVTVGISGTGGGFKKFFEAAESLRTDINNASRPIKASEIESAKKLGIEYIELPIAYDGLAVVVNPSNTFCDHLTKEELKRIWEPDSKINNWKDVRPGFPDVALKLFGPGPDSGTFDYFTEVIVGKEKASRTDYNPSESDNTLVQGVAGEKGALGYFGLSYYNNNKSKLKAVAIDSGDGKPIMPSVETVRNHTYRPLSRPLFIYVNRKAADRPEVVAFVNDLVKNAAKVVEHPRVGYVAVPDEIYAAAARRLSEKIVGTVYSGPEATHKSLTELYGGKPAGKEK